VMAEVDATDTMVLVDAELTTTGTTTELDVAIGAGLGTVATEVGITAGAEEASAAVDEGRAQSWTVTVATLDTVTTLGAAEVEVVVPQPLAVNEISTQVS